MDWAMFITNSVLVVVTGAYVLLTRKLAESSADAAGSALRAAEAAERAAAIGAASVDVRFRVFGSYFGGGPKAGQSVVGVSLECEGASVYVHGATLLAVATGQEIHGGRGATYQPLATNAPLKVHPTSGSLPRKVHPGEALTFKTEPPVMTDDIMAIGSLHVQLEYSFDGGDDRTHREARWDMHSEGSRRLELYGDE